jgi:hypothetical protein
MGDAIRVFWEDSTQSGGWCHPHCEETPVRIEDVCSLGFFVNSSERGLNLTTSLSSHGGVLSIVSIPWASIRTIQRIPEWNSDHNLPSSGNLAKLEALLSG